MSLQKGFLQRTLNNFSVCRENHPANEAPPFPGTARAAESFLRRRMGDLGDLNSEPAPGAEGRETSQTQHLSDTKPLRKPQIPSSLHISERIPTSIDPSVYVSNPETFQPLLIYVSRSSSLGEFFSLRLENPWKIHRKFTEKSIENHGKPKASILLGVLGAIPTLGATA